MNEIKRLWDKRYEPQGRIDITVFFVNIFLIICHIFLMIIYIIIGHSFMTWVNVVSLFVYLFYLFRCYRNIERYMGLAFLEIWLHQIFGILSFGWTPCYQNWCFGMIAAYFLPAFSHNDGKKVVKRPFFFAFLIIFSYFFLATTFPLMHLSITKDLGIVTNSILFILNNGFTFISITMFAMFYTKRTDRNQRELSRKADYDELTALYNRYALNQMGERIATSAEVNNKNYSVAIIDIDFFKKVNDTYGHTSGDLVLKQLATYLRQCSIKGIVSGRWGGEEFVLISPHNISYETFTTALEKLRIKVEKTKFTIEKKKQIKVTISIGATCVDGTINLEDAVSKADVNLYKAKESGRNKLVKKI